MENEKNITTDTNIVGTEGATHSVPTMLSAERLERPPMLPICTSKSRGRPSRRSLKGCLKPMQGVKKVHDTIDN